MNQDKETIIETSQQKTAAFVLRIVGQFLLFLAVLIAIGIMLHTKINDSINTEVAKFGHHQGQLVSTMYYNLFEGELSQLENAGKLITLGQLSPQDVSKILGEGVGSAGLVDINGSVISGAPLPEGSQPQRLKAFQGDASIDYYHHIGLIAMVPVYEGNNIRYVLYRLHSEAELRDPNSHLQLSDHQESADILLYDLAQQKVVAPFKGYGPGNRFYDEATATPVGIAPLLEKLENSDTSSLYDPDVQADYAIFASRIPNTTFAAIGYVEWESVVAGIRNIHLIILWVFGLLVVLFCVFILYSFANQAAAEESKELREARDDALRANQAKSDFLANMSHEIRTPLNAILGMNEMIMREAKGTMKEYAYNVKSAGETLLAIINDILDFSKIESGKMEIIPASYSLSSVLNDIYNMVSYKARQKGLEFNINVSPTIPDSLHGDEVRLRQILVNILNNAVKYTPKGSVTFTVQAGDSGISDDGLELEFICQDTGLGIKEEDKRKLFYKFQRLDMKKNRTIEGTGLGLAITTSLVQMMHGSISVESTYGEGSTFTVRLPQRVEHYEPMGDFKKRIEDFLEQQEAYQESFTAPDARILVVDDTEMNLIVVQSLLEKTEIQIETAFSGMECLEMLKETHYDLVFLDHMMPEMDGIETLKQAKELKGSKNKKTPFVALTANAVSGVREMFLANGFDDYLSKPVDGKTLEQMVQKYLPENKIQPVTKDEFDFGTEEFYHHQSDYYEPHGNSQDSQAAQPPQAGNPPAPQEPPQTAVPAPAAEAEAAATAGTTTGAAEAGAAAGTTAAAAEATAEAVTTADTTAALATPEASASSEATAEAAAPEDEQIDLPTAMKYCGGMEAMQIKFLTLYVSRYQMVRDQLQKDFDEENIPDYTTHVHALKSTSLSIGGVKLSEAAKALEMAGHAIQDGPEEEKQAFMDYIKENHGPTMEMYKKLIEEAKTRFGVEPES